ncbi:hypothetical protein LCGC14_0370880 [marine sediment metagenome]|uniref:Uncharacterized protein n=1 Tax=marine sediment metagenome TaxID=412755 RepID=A0A0F9TN97_9ZZZZ|nr:hypothetical protein [Maribacter sp.]HDZ04850.1 hypothetical protein [Maribacter sp.]
MQVTIKEKLLVPEEIIPAHESEVEKERFHECDKCEEKIAHGSHSADEFTFELVQGFRYPGSGDGQTEEMELCTICANELVTLLKANGYRIIKSKWNY